MIDLHRFTLNPFDDPRISINRLLAFSIDHLARMKANDADGSLAGRIAATDTALTAVQFAFGDDKTKLAIRKAHKQTKGNFRAALPGGIGKIYGAVLAAFGAGSVEMKECFPSGRNVFNKCTDGALAEELQTLINGLADYPAQLGAPAADASALLAAWQTAYAASQSSAGNKAATMEDKLSAQSALQLELFLNLLTIALKHPRQPAMVDLHMQQSLLENHPHQAAAPATT